MTKVLTLGFEFEHDYTLIAINSTLEDYRLAYLLNKEFNIRLNCQPEGLSFKDKNCTFTFYDYECNISFNSWSVGNRHPSPNCSSIFMASCHGIGPASFRWAILPI